MTYHHTPGHPVVDIYAQADLEWQIDDLDSRIEEAYADGGLDPEDESLLEVVKSNLRRIWDEEEYHHTPVPPHVWDIYENYLKRKEFLQSVADVSEKWNSAMRRLGDRLRRLPAFSPRRKQSVHATEHPIEAEEGWLGGTDFDSDDPGGRTR